MTTFRWTLPVLRIGSLTEVEVPMTGYEGLLNWTTLESKYKVALKNFVLKIAKI